MHISGPGSVDSGKHVSVTVSGLPENATHVYFSAGASTDEIPGRGSAAWQFMPNCSGPMQVTAVAKNEHGQPLGFAHHMLAVRHIDTMADAGGGSSALTVRYPTQLPQKTFTQMIVENIAQAHTLTLEFYQANGGIFRYFPRGRQAMPLVFRLLEPGETSFYLVARDQALQTLAIRQGVMRVSASQTPVDANMQNASSESMSAAMPVLGADNKPPLAETDQMVHAQMDKAPPQQGPPVDLGQALQERLESRLLKRFE